MVSADKIDIEVLDAAEPSLRVVSTMSGSVGYGEGLLQELPLTGT